MQRADLGSKVQIRDKVIPKERHDQVYISHLSLGSPGRNVDMGGVDVDQRYSNNPLGCLGLRGSFYNSGRLRVDRLDVLQQPSRLR